MTVPAAEKGVARAVAMNTLWGSAGRLFGGVLAFATVAVTRRALGAEGYGGYATILAFLYLFNAIADGGLYNLLVRDLGAAAHRHERILGTAVLLRTIALSVSLSVGLVLFASIGKYGNLVAAAPLAALSYAALSFGQLFVAVLQRYFAVWRATVAEIIARAAQFVLSVMLWRIGVHALPAFLGILGIVGVLQLTLLWRASSAFVPLRLRTTRGEAAAMLREALPIAVSLLFTLVYFRIDTVLLSMLRSIEEAGIYNLAYKILEQLIFFPAMFVGVLTPVLADAFVRDRSRFSRILDRSQSIIAASALPMVVGGFVLAAPLADLLGDRAAAAPMRILLLGTALIFFGTILGQTIIVVGEQRRAVRVYAIAMLINVVGNLLLIPRFSFHGAAWMTVATEAAVDIGLIVLLKAAGISFRIPNLGRIAAATAVMGVPLALLAPPVVAAIGVWSLVPFLIACPILYGGALLAFRAISAEDLRILLRSASP